MLMLFEAWRDSLSILSPRRFFRFCLSCLRNVAKALITLAKNFWWLVCIQVLFAGMLGYTHWKVSVAGTSQESATAMVETFSALHNIALLCALMLGFLIMRQESTQNLRGYLFRKIPNVIFFHFWWNIIALIAFALLLNLKVYNFPSLPKAVSLFIDFFTWLQLLVWLEGRPSTLNFLGSLEKTANLICYNMPFITLLFALALGGNFFIDKYVMTFLIKDAGATTVPVITSIISSVRKTIFASGGVLLLKFLWASIIIAFYRRKKDDEYTELFFKV